LSNNKK